MAQHLEPESKETEINLEEFEDLYQIIEIEEMDETDEE